MFRHHDDQVLVIPRPIMTQNGRGPPFNAVEPALKLWVDQWRLSENDFCSCCHLYHAHAFTSD